MTAIDTQHRSSGSEDPPRYPHRHLLGIEGLTRSDIDNLLDRSDGYVEQNRRADKKNAFLRGRTLINLFFEN